MALGVYVACEDLAATEALSNALESAPDVFLSPTADRADVVIAAPPQLDGVPPGPAVVVLATGEDSLAAAREAIARGAQGILGWPADEAVLSLRLHDAAARRVPADGTRGRIVTVAGARGGAGATTVAAYLARAMGEGALLVDLTGGVSGQALFAPSEPPATLAGLALLLGEISAETLTRIAHDHASGRRCVYGGAARFELGRLPSALRDAAPVAVTDGAIAGDLTLVVVGPDVGSVRAAAAMVGDGVEVVLNRAARRRVRAAEVERALGRRPIAAIPDDPRIARAADLGRLIARGEAVRAFRRLARRVRELLPA